MRVGGFEMSFSGLFFSSFLLVVDAELHFFEVELFEELMSFAHAWELICFVVAFAVVIIFGSGELIVGVS